VPGGHNSKSTPAQSFGTLVEIPMRTFLIIIVFSLCSCRSSSSATDTRVYIATIDSTYSGKEKEISEFESKTYFSQDFWIYFIKKFPRSTYNIFFYSSLANTPDFIKLKDTSYKIAIPDYAVMWALRNNLPEKAEENEVIDRSDLRKFENILVPKLTKEIREEYSTFIQILKNKKSPPIFVYKENFLIQIEEAYY
jgi:hypothetical protein